MSENDLNNAIIGIVNSAGYTSIAKLLATQLKAGTVLGVPGCTGQDLLCAYNHWLMKGQPSKSDIMTKCSARQYKTHNGTNAKIQLKSKRTSGNSKETKKITQSSSQAISITQPEASTSMMSQHSADSSSDAPSSSEVVNPSNLTTGAEEESGSSPGTGRPILQTATSSSQQNNAGDSTYSGDSSSDDDAIRAAISASKNIQSVKWSELSSQYNLPRLNSTGSTNSTAGSARAAASQEQPTIQGRTPVSHQGDPGYGQILVPAKLAFKCATCPKTFTWKKSLRRHMREVHERAGKDYSCADCRQVFWWRVDLLTHRKEMHTHGLGKYICDKQLENGVECGKDYPRKKALVEHVRDVHENRSSHQCPICQKPFTRQSHVNKHIEYCSERFRRQNDHVFSRSPLLPVKCKYCDRRFQEKAGARAHMKKSHKEAVDRALKKSHKEAVDRALRGAGAGDASQGGVGTARVHADVVNDRSGSHDVMRTPQSRTTQDSGGAAMTHLLQEMGEEAILSYLQSA